jgi:hypothetical protein
MAFVVRRGNLETDGELIINFLAQNHTPDSDHRRFDWLYRRGPAGPARVWIVTESTADSVIGLAAAFPRQVCIRGNETRGWVLGDFCILRSQRSLGPATLLQRACLADLSLNDEIYYDFPSPSMTAVYQRIGIMPQLHGVRLTKLLRVDAKLQAWIRSPHLARISAAAINAALALNNRHDKMERDVIASVHQGPCEKEFTELARSVALERGVCLLRTSEYLTWRYQQHPYRRYEIVALRSAGCLQGYSVISQEGSHLSVVDILGINEMIPQLLQVVVSIAIDRQLDTATVSLLGSDVWRAVFRRAGFHVRETFPVIARKPNSTIFDGTWFLTNGDRES